MASARPFSAATAASRSASRAAQIASNEISSTGGSTSGGRPVSFASGPLPLVPFTANATPVVLAHTISSAAAANMPCSSTLKGPGAGAHRTAHARASTGNPASCRAATMAWSAFARCSVTTALCTTAALRCQGSSVTARAANPNASSNATQASTTRDGDTTSAPASPTKHGLNSPWARSRGRSSRASTK